MCKNNPGLAYGSCAVTITRVTSFHYTLFKYPNGFQISKSVLRPVNRKKTEYVRSDLCSANLNRTGNELYNKKVFPLIKRVRANVFVRIIGNPKVTWRMCGRRHEVRLIARVIYTKLGGHSEYVYFN